MTEGRQCLLGMAEILHWFWDSVGCGADGLELSLKLYHAGELQLDPQHLMTEAPYAVPVTCG